MRVRKLDIGGDMTFGNGAANFWHDVPDGPAQCVMTRLALKVGQWFLDRTAGTPWDTKVLGKYTGNTRDPVVRARTLGTQGVTRIDAYASVLSRDKRAFAVGMLIDTQYGAAKVVGPI